MNPPSSGSKGEVALTRQKITVTSALPYANGEIHLGHVVSTYLPADVFTRYCRLKGHDVIHICATDDFGTPILIKAEEEGKPLHEYVAYWNARDQEDFTRLGISFDFFHETSSPENITMTQYFFTELYRRDHLTKQTILQPYCEYDRKFLPDRYVIGTCPYCKAPDQYSDGCEVCGRAFQPGEVVDARCAICGRKPVQRESLHFFFKLSEFSEALKKWLLNNRNLQPDVKNYVLSWVEGGLKDWDITRDISWGVPIPLPEAAGKVLYGWFDNHLCYISATLAYLASKGIDGKAFWNASRIYHFIGKDIVYHHYLFLPAMRLGVGDEYKLPDFIPTRGHLMLQGEKFSKSRGWYVSLREFLEAFPADYLRYYLSSITPYSQADVNFDWSDFHARINNELVANIGNFIHRTLTFIASNYDSIVPQPRPYDELDWRLVEQIKRLSDDVGRRIEENHLEKALKLIVDFSAFCNQYFQRKEPWASLDTRDNCLYLCVNATRSLAILLEPYLPFSVERLWKQLNLIGSVHEASWDSASRLSIPAGHTISKPSPLFRKIEKREIAKQKEKLPEAGSLR